MFIILAVRNSLLIEFRYKITFHNWPSHWCMSNNVLWQGSVVHSSWRWHIISIHGSLANQRSTISALLRQLLARVGWSKNSSIYSSGIWNGTIHHTIQCRSQTNSSSCSKSGVETYCIFDNVWPFVHQRHVTCMATTSLLYWASNHSAPELLCLTRVAVESAVPGLKSWGANFFSWLSFC